MEGGLFLVYFGWDFFNYYCWMRNVIYDDKLLFYFNRQNLLVNNFQCWSGASLLKWSGVNPCVKGFVYFCIFCLYFCNEELVAEFMKSHLYSSLGFLFKLHVNVVFIWRIVVPVLGVNWFVWQKRSHIYVTVEDMWTFSAAIQEDLQL